MSLSPSRQCNLGQGCGQRHNNGPAWLHRHLRRRSGRSPAWPYPPRRYPYSTIITSSGTVSYLLGGHLGSTSITANSSGAKIAELRYHPWGSTRYTSGTTPTSYQYTGQRKDSYIGLHFYNARFYPSASPGAGDPKLGRFAVSALYGQSLSASHLIVTRILKRTLPALSA